MKMKIDLKKLLDLIETKTSWGKNELKEAILRMLADDSD
jgi:hypothetical protein